MRGRIREVVIYYKFHENRSSGLRAVEGRKSPSPIDLAHGLYNTLYYRTSRDFEIFVPDLYCNIMLLLFSISSWKWQLIINDLINFFKIT